MTEGTKVAVFCIFAFLFVFFGFFVPGGFAQAPQPALKELIIIEEKTPRLDKIIVEKIIVDEQKPPGLEDLIVVEEEEEEEPTTWTRRVLEFLDRYTFGEGGGYYAYGDTSERAFAIARVGIDYSFDTKDWTFLPFSLGRGRVYVSGGYTYRYTKLEIELETTSVLPDGAETKTKRTITLDPKDSSWGLAGGLF